MSDLHIARGLKLDADYVGGGTFGLLAKKGAGKSYTARVMCEEMWKARIPFVLLDPMGTSWGLRSSADGEGEGIPVAIFGGEHADAPLERKSGGLMADLVVDERLSMVLDMSVLGSRAAEREFALDFFDRLYRRNRELVHVLVDEADLFAPQKPQAGDRQLLGVTENIVRRGRNRGIGITLITQRPAVLNKDVLTQVDGLVAMRITGLTDREAIDKWVAGHGDDPEEAAKVKATLAGLENGECWWWVPELGILKRVQVRESRTFDSSPTKRRGEKRRDPKSFADVDMGAIESKMADTIERARAEDPKELRRQIVELQKQLRDRPDVEPETVEVEVVREVFPPALKEALLRAAGDLSESLQELLEPAHGLAARFEKAIEDDFGLALEIEDARAQDGAVRPVRPAPPKSPARPAPRVAATPPSANGDSGKLGKAARALLEVLVQQHPRELTRSQTAALAGYSVRKSTFRNALSELRVKGLLKERGDLLAPSDAGFGEAGDVGEMPRSTDELLAWWRGRLGKAARSLFDVLVAIHPDGLDRADLAEQAGMDPAVSTFRNALSELRMNALLDEARGAVRASDDLFLGTPA